MEDASTKLEAGEAITSWLEVNNRTRQMLFRQRAILSCKEVNMYMKFIEKPVETKTSIS